MLFSMCHYMYMMYVIQYDLFLKRNRKDIFQLGASFVHVQTVSQMQCINISCKTFILLITGETICCPVCVLP